ncbi:MAG: M12 family metallo-peptidase [Bdellovibrionota bacterium]
MKSDFLKLIIAFVLISIYTISAYAQNDPYHALSRGMLSQMKQAFVEADTLVGTEAINWKLQLRVPGVGRVNCEYNSKRGRGLVPTRTVNGLVVQDDSPILLLQGKYESNLASGPLAGSIFNDRGTDVLYVSFYASNRDGDVEFYDIKVPLSQGDSVYSRITRARKSKNRCAAPSHESVLHTLQRSLESQPVTQQKALLSIDADKAWSEMHGSSANNFLSTIVNNVITVYLTDTTTTVELVRQNIFPSKTFGSASQDIEVALDEFQAFIPNQSYFGTADSYHLMSAISYPGGLGIANFNVLCRTPSRSMGVNAYTTLSDTAVTLAHELGHNASATHDDPGGPSIMSISFFEPPLTFATKARGEIMGHMAKNGDSCIGTEEVVPEDPLDFAETYLTRIQEIINRAKKPLTDRTKKRKKKNIRSARSEIKSKIRELITLEGTSGDTIRDGLPNYSLASLRKAQKQAKKGSSTKVTANLTKKKWKQFTKTITTLLGN